MADLTQLGIEISADANKATKAIDQLATRLENLSKSLSGLSNAGVLTTLSKGVTDLSTAMGGISAIRKDTFTKVAEKIQVIADVNASNLDSTAEGLTAISGAIQAMSGVKTDTIQGIASAMQSLGNTKSGNAISNLPQLATQLEDFSRRLEGLPNISSQVAGLQSVMNTVYKLGSTTGNLAKGNLTTVSAQLQNFLRQLSQINTTNIDTTKISDLVSSINRLGYATSGKAVTNIPNLADALKKLFTTLSQCPKISKDIIKMTNALANLSANVGGIRPRTEQASAGLNNFATHARKAKKETMSLASAFGKFYASMFLFIRGIKAVGKGVGKAMNAIEVENYFEQAITQIGIKASKEMGIAGQKSAENYAENYANELKSRQNQITDQMTGFAYDDNSRMMMRTNTKNLGLNPNELVQYQAQFMQMADSMGASAKNAEKLSNAYTKLGADLASIRDVDTAEAWSNLASGMVGQTKVMDKFGINIRVAALNEQLMNMGIDTTVAKLGAEDKALLRTIVMLDRSRGAWTDLSRTLESPANQFRILQSNLSSLGMAIGNVLLAGVARVLPYINALVKALQTLVQYLTRVFGIQLPKITTQGSSSFEGLADGIDDAGDSLDDASGKAKKLKNNLLGIDELNVISDNNGSSSSGAPSYDGNEIQEAFDTLYDEYMQAWDKAYANMDDKIQRITDSIVDAFKNGDYEGIGEYITKGLANQLKKIDWDKVYDANERGGSGLARFFNGLLDPESFEVFGKTFASLINAKFHFIAGFVRDFDWINAGLSLASFVNGFARTLDAKLIGKTISDAIIGGLKLINSFLDNTDFYQVGKTIGDIFAELKWGEILKETAKAILKGLAGALTSMASLFNADPIGGLIADVLLASILLKIASKGAKKSLLFADSISKLFGGKGLQGGISKTGNSIGLTLCQAIMAVVIAYQLGEKIAEIIGMGEYSLGKYIKENGFGGTGEGTKEMLDNQRKMMMMSLQQEANKAYWSVTDPSKIDGGTASKYQEMIAHIKEAQQAMAEAGYSADDYYRALDMGVTKVGDLSEAEFNLMRMIIEQQSGISDTTRLQLLYSIGLGDTSQALDLETKATENANAKRLEQLHALSEVKTRYEELPNEVQKVIEKEEKHSKTVDEISKKYNVTTPKMREYASQVGLTKEEIDKFNVTTKTQADALSATKDAVSRYAEEQRKLGEKNLETNNSTKDLALSLKDMGITSEELSGYVKVIGETDLPKLQTSVTELTEVVDSKMPHIVSKFKSMSDSIRDYMLKVRNYMTQEFMPIFSEENMNEMLSGVLPAFQNTFSGVLSTLQSMFNRFADAINNAVHVTWEGIEVNGEKVVEAGEAQLFTMRHIEGFATGGMPNRGSLFYANEGGSAEMIGQIGSRTAVVNNDQIVQAVSSGVRNAVADAMIPYLSQIANNTEISANKNFSVNIGDRDIARANTRGQRMMGRSIISTI